MSVGDEATAVLVLADDLTGAADAGVVFASAGLETVLVLAGGGESAAAAGADVLAVDTDSRRSGTAAARTAVRAAVRSIGFRHAVYKKIDSTLRGNVAAETEAALDATGGDVAVVAPAFPATGRTTLHGRQLVAGLPLRSTGVWRGAEERAPERVAELFAGSALAVREVGLARVRGGPEPIAAALREAVSTGARVVVCDAETDEDLAGIAAAGAAQRGLRLVWVGSGGLAAHLPRVLGIGSDGADRSAGAAVPPMSSGSLLAVVGSAAAQSQEQADALRAAGFAAVRLPAGVLGAAGEAELAHWASDVLRVVRQHDTVLTVTGGESLDDHSAATRVAARIGQVVTAALPAAAGLILTGGETARAVLGAAGVRALRLVGETEPGVVVSHADHPLAVPVVTKAGAFGGKDALVRAARAWAGSRTPAGDQEGGR